MSVSDNVAQLAAHAHDFMQNGVAATNVALDTLSRAAQNLARVRELATESMSVAVSLLGSGHPGTGTIGQTANAVAGRADEVESAIMAAISSMAALDQAIVEHSSTMGQVAHALQQGGS